MGRRPDSKKKPGWLAQLVDIKSKPPSKAIRPPANAPGKKKSK